VPLAWLSEAGGCGILFATNLRTFGLQLAAKRNFKKSREYANPENSY
jgi:hypothetical protein